jgi:hypothetical protein
VEPKNGIVKSAKGALYGPGIVRLFYPSKYPQNKPGTGGWDNEGYGVYPSTLPEKIWGELKIFISDFLKIFYSVTGFFENLQQRCRSFLKMFDNFFGFILELPETFVNFFRKSGEGSQDFVDYDSFPSGHIGHCTGDCRLSEDHDRKNDQHHHCNREQDYQFDEPDHFSFPRFLHNPGTIHPYGKLIYFHPFPCSFLHISGKIMRPLAFSPSLLP